MKKAKIVFIVIALVLIVAGGAMFGVAYAKGYGFSSIKPEIKVNTYEIKEDFDNFKLTLTISDVEVIKAEENKVEVYETDKLKHTVEVKDNTLNITSDDTTKWYENWFFTHGDLKVKIYLKDTEYDDFVITNHTGNIKIPNDFTFDVLNIYNTTGDINTSCNVTGGFIAKTSTGDIKVEGINPKSCNITATTGHVELNNTNIEEDLYIETSTGKNVLKNVTARNIKVISSTGSKLLTNVVAKEELYLKSSTGDIDIIGVDGASINIQTSTGDVEGSILTGKMFETNTRTGKVRVPGSVEGGKCYISTSTGDIIIEIKA